MKYSVRVVISSAHHYVGQHFSRQWNKAGQDTNNHAFERSLDTYAVCVFSSLLAT